MAKKILLIEDDRALLRMYKTAFGKSGCLFYSATDGIDGLKKAKAKKPDLILLDLVLPKLDGFEVLRTLKKNPATADIPVFCLTVLHQEEDMEKAKTLGAQAYLVKTDLLPKDVVARAVASIKK